MASVNEEVLIGLCDEAVGGKSTTCFTNKIGGLPDYPPSVSLHNPCCAVCGAVLAHIVQVYCPLEVSPYHRTVNVFACARPECSGKSESWKVLRSQFLESHLKVTHRVKVLQKKEVPMTSNDWFEGADDWGVEEEQDAVSDPTQSGKSSQSCFVPKVEVSNKLLGLSLTETVECPPLEFGLVLPGSLPVFKPYYICVVEEGSFKEQPDMEHVQRLLQDYETREGITIGQLDSSEGVWEVEKYEKTQASHGDKVFCKFMKRISICPKQILRYCWNGSPLLITDLKSKVAQRIPPCSYCGNQRIFEFQLMPAFVSFLSPVNQSSVAGVWNSVRVHLSKQLLAT
ncbi:programmed cell death protein 2-like isoform X2 [Scleropages formosus]|uniref:programmed cell death protein 2-like isoform X2 n=1 Tax=Scleropages formosus TaxID=113540 RepID=UPI00087889C4|nr:programmed cell death protein 2-like isoform X2 [Scleropages formosus]